VVTAENFAKCTGEIEPQIAETLGILSRIKKNTEDYSY